jgi:hypothetical protein
LPELEANKKFDSHRSVTSVLISSEGSVRAGEYDLTKGEPGVGVVDVTAPGPALGVELGPDFFCCLFLLS